MLPHTPLLSYLRARSTWMLTQVGYYAKEVLPIVLPQGIMAAVVLEMFVGIDLRVIPGMADISFQPQGLAALSHRAERSNLLMSISVFNTLLVFIAVFHLIAARMRRMRASG